MPEQLTLDPKGPGKPGLPTSTSAPGTKQFWFAAVALITAFLLAASVFVYVQTQMGQATPTKNAGIKAVNLEVSMGAGKNWLGFTDVANVAQIAQNASARDVAVTTSYRIPMGLTTTDDAAFFVQGVGGDAATALGLANFGTGQVAGDIPAGELTLEVPVVQVQNDGGMVSAGQSELPLTGVPLPNEYPLLSFQPATPDTLFVNEETFQSILLLMSSGQAWDEVQRDHDAGASHVGAPVVHAIYLSISGADNAKNVEQALREARYDPARDGKIVSASRFEIFMVLGGGALALAALVSAFVALRRGRKLRQGIA